jgi:predicted amidophosphoribosyltransferase
MVDGVIPIEGISLHRHPRREPTMSYCSKCGKENPGDISYCVGCGTPLRPERTLEENVRTFGEEMGRVGREVGRKAEKVAKDVEVRVRRALSDPVYCPGCGLGHRTDDVFCARCGKRLRDE